MTTSHLPVAMKNIKKEKLTSLELENKKLKRIKRNVRMEVRELSKECKRLKKRKTLAHFHLETVSKMIDDNKIKNTYVTLKASETLKEVNQLTSLNNYRVSHSYMFDNKDYYDITCVSKGFYSGVLDVAFTNGVKVDLKLKPVIEESIGLNHREIQYHEISITININEDDEDEHCVYSKNQANILLKLTKDKIIPGNQDSHVVDELMRKIGSMLKKIR